MTNRALALRKRFISMLCAGFVVFAGGLFGAALAAPQISPTLISTSTTTRAIALESVTMQSEPFSLSSEGNFNAADPRTRIGLHATAGSRAFAYRSEWKRSGPCYSSTKACQP